MEDYLKYPTKNPQKVWCQSHFVLRPFSIAPLPHTTAAKHLSRFRLHIKLFLEFGDIFEDGIFWSFVNLKHSILYKCPILMHLKRWLLVHTRGDPSTKEMGILNSRNELLRRTQIPSGGIEHRSRNSRLWKSRVLGEATIEYTTITY